VHDVRKLCSILLRTYSLGSKKSSKKQQQDADEVCTVIFVSFA